MYPEANPSEWPYLVSIPHNGNANYYIATPNNKNKVMAYRLFTKDNLFGDPNDTDTWAYNYIVDNSYGVTTFKVFTKESNFKDIQEIHIGKNGKISYDKPQKVYSPWNKVKWTLNKPVFENSVDKDGKVFRISEEQFQQLKEITATTTVSGQNTDYQYTVPFMTGKNDETMQRHNGEGGSVSINHIDESNKESLHTSNVGDYINDNPIAIHPEGPTMKRGEGKHGSHGIERIEEGKKYVNMDVELRKGGRNAVKMSVDDFKSEMAHAYHEYAMEQPVEYGEPDRNIATPLNEEQNKFLEKHGIKEVSCGLGYSEKEQKWYGWSHRGACGFGVGDKFKECYPTGTKTGKIIKTLDQAKEAAEKFADSIS